MTEKTFLMRGIIELFANLLDFCPFRRAEKIGSDILDTDTSVVSSNGSDNTPRKSASGMEESNSRNETKLRTEDELESNGKSDREAIRAHNYTSFLEILQQDCSPSETNCVASPSQEQGIAPRQVQSDVEGGRVIAREGDSGERKAADLFVEEGVSTSRRIREIEIGETPNGVGEPSLQERLLEIERGRPATEFLTSLGFPKTMKIFTNDQTAKAIGELKDLPALASIARSFRSVVGSSDVDVNEVVKVVDKDPSISAKILHTANSAYYATAQPVDNLNNAIQLIGVRRVRFLSYALNTISDTNLLVEGINWRNLWIHNFACGLLSGELAEYLKLPDTAYYYVAGLLHDIGKIVLSYIYPAGYKQALLHTFDREYPLNIWESMVFGMTHEEAGGIYARENRLARPLEMALRYHRAPQKAEEEPIVCALVNISNHLCKRFGLGFSGSQLYFEDENLCSLPGWVILNDRVGGKLSYEFFEDWVSKHIPSFKREIYEVVQTSFAD